MSDVDRCDDHGSWNEIDLARRSDGRHGDDHVNDYDGGRMNVDCLDDRVAIFLKTSGTLVFDYKILIYKMRC